MVPAGAARPLGGAQPRVVRAPQRLVQGGLVVAHVVRGARRRRERESVGRDQVLPPELRRIHPELRREHVHRAFDERRGLRAPRAAVRCDRGGVRHHAAAGARDGGEAIDAGEHLLRSRGHEGADRVGAHVREELDAHPHEGAVARGPQLHPLDLRASVREVEHALRARFDPAHRSPQDLRRAGHHEVLGVDLELGAEASPDVGRDGAHLPLPHAEGLGEVVAHVERDLRRDVDGERAVRLRDHRDAVGLHRDRSETLVHEAPPDDHVGPREHVRVPGPRTRAPRSCRTRATGGGRRRRPRPRRR